MNRVLKVPYNRTRRTKTEPLYQYDYGQLIKFEYFDLPEAYEVHFSNVENCSEATTSIGNADGVEIPDIYLQSGEHIYAWLYLHDTESDGETEYRIEIPVIRRARPTNKEPGPVQQDTITQTIAALNAAVEHTERNVEQTEEMMDVATEAAMDASESAYAAGVSEHNAQGWAAASEVSANRSEERSIASAQSATNARNSELAAARSELAAATSETNAKESELAAADSENDAFQSKLDAADSASAAKESEISAAASAERALDSVGQAGYLFFYIENGDLYMERTNEVSVDFYMENGNLYVKELD